MKREYWKAKEEYFIKALKYLENLSPSLRDTFPSFDKENDEIIKEIVKKHSLEESKFRKEMRSYLLRVLNWKVRARSPFNPSKRFLKK